METMVKVVKHRSCKHLMEGLLTIMLVAVMTLPSCSTDQAADPPPVRISPAAPQRADLLCRIEMGKILDNEAFAELFRVLATQNAEIPQTLDVALNEVKNKAGTDLRDITEAVVFADTSTLDGYLGSPQGSKSAPYFGALVEGDLDEISFILSIEEGTAQMLKRRDYQDHVIYTIAALDDQEEVLSVACPADGNFVIGTSQAVEDVIDVIAGLQEPISGEVFDLYSQLGDTPAKLASAVPEYLTEQIPEQIALGPINVSLSSFRDIDYATLILTGNEAVIDAVACLEFTSADSARTSDQLLSTGILAAKNLMPDHAVRELLSRVQISRSGSFVSLTLALSVSEIESLISLMSAEEKQ